ncbi:MAG: ABC transporter permease [Stappiaceae bacterium]
MNTPGSPLLATVGRSQTLAVSVVLLLIIAIWYIAAIFLNTAFQEELYKRANRVEVSTEEFVTATLSQERPVLPSPHQVLEEIWKTTALKKVTSKRSLVYHSWITLSTTLVGFVIGTLLGIVLAVLIVHSRVLDKSLMPWIITSQTIPILAIAPMIIVVLNAVGISGLLPKAFISTYLSFFPVAVGMTKGLRSPDAINMDLMKTFSAGNWQVFWKLRLPSSLPYLFTSMKIAIAIALVGAIVGELPTGAVSGLGARLLSGSYYGQTVQIWSALLTAAFLAAALVAIVDILNQVTLKRMGLS